MIKDNKVDDLASEWVFETNGSKWSNNDDTAGDNYGSFKAGFKACEKLMYSEEEVLRLMIKCKDTFSGPNLEDYTPDEVVYKWFERFSKNGKERD